MIILGLDPGTINLGYAIIRKDGRKFTLIEDMIVENQFDTEKFHKKWQELEDILGKNYFDLKLLKLEIASRRKDVQNN
jgi:Holliday junction resolvasome RuvABC endonuclease subunit